MRPAERPLVTAAFLVLSAIGALSAAGAVATVVVTARDGYHRVPTRRA